MTLITVSNNYGQLAFLSQLLISLIPGCTIHQCCDPMRAIQHLACRKVDAMFADADTICDMMNMLSRQKKNTQIWILCRQGTALPEIIAGYYGALTYPITEQEMRTALQRTIRCVEKNRKKLENDCTIFDY